MMKSNRPFHFCALQLLIVQLALLEGAALAARPAGQLNVKINDTRVDYDGDTSQRSLSD